MREAGWGVEPISSKRESVYVCMYVCKHFFIPLSRWVSPFKLSAFWPFPLLSRKILYFSHSAFLVRFFSPNCQSQKGWNFQFCNISSLFPFFSATKQIHVLCFRSKIVFVHFVLFYFYPSIESSRCCDLLCFTLLVYYLTQVSTFLSSVSIFEFEFQKEIDRFLVESGEFEIDGWVRVKMAGFQIFIDDYPQFRVSFGLCLGWEEPKKSNLRIC